MKRHHKILVGIVIAVALTFAAGRIAMWNQAAQYDAAHP